jgi:hypothetical protein
MGWQVLPVGGAIVLSEGKALVPKQAKQTKIGAVHLDGNQLSAIARNARILGRGLVPQLPDRPTRERWFACHHR